MNCKEGCLTPHLHIVSLEKLSDPEVLDSVARDVVIFGSAYVRVDLQDINYAKKFYGKSVIEDIKESITKTLGKK